MRQRFSSLLKTGSASAHFFARQTAEVRLLLQLLEFRFLKVFPFFLEFLFILERFRKVTYVEVLSNTSETEEVLATLLITLYEIVETFVFPALMADVKTEDRRFFAILPSTSSI